MSDAGRYLPLERAETHGVRARTSTERRAGIEEQLLTALACGDGQRVSELRCVLASLVSDADEVPAT